MLKQFIKMKTKSKQYLGTPTFKRYIECKTFLQVDKLPVGIKFKAGG